jgi:hypothetical protein
MGDAVGGRRQEGAVIALDVRYGYFSRQYIYVSMDDAVGSRT